MKEVQGADSILRMAFTMITVYTLTYLSPFLSLSPSLSFYLYLYASATMSLAADCVANNASGQVHRGTTAIY